MTYHEPARAGVRRARSGLPAALVVVGAVLAGAGATRSPTGDSDSGPVAGTGAPGVGVRSGQRSAEEPAGTLPIRRDHATGRSRGGQTVFDDRTPTVAKLDPALLQALRRAATDAARDGVQLRVTSGWRSAQHQEQLLRDAIATYGSAREAARWVATPRRSAHVSGDAVDIGPSGAARWLSRHGSAYGLCQIYGNEPWHYERRPGAVDGGCPAMYADPTHDPRMQQ